MNLFLIKLLPELSLNKIPIVLSLLYIVFALFVLKLSRKKGLFRKYNFRYAKILFVLLPPLFIILFFVFPKIPNRTEYFDPDKDGYSQTKYQYQWWKTNLIEVDANNDRRIDDWSFYDSNGRLKDSELDTNFDGKVDFWAYYASYNNMEYPIRVEQDNNYDGTKNAPLSEEILNDNDFTTTTRLSPTTPESNLYYYQKGKLLKSMWIIDEDNKTFYMSYFNNKGIITKKESYEKGELYQIVYYDSQGKEDRLETLVDGKWEISTLEE